MAISIVDAAYIAGLFDGEGSIDFAKRKEKKSNGKAYLCQRITMRIEMCDEHVLRWIHEKLGVGTVRKRNRSPSRKAHWKDAWVYSVRFRQAYQVAKLLWPYAQVKLHKIEQIIDHYEPEHNDHNVVNLEDYRK